MQKKFFLVTLCFVFCLSACGGRKKGIHDLYHAFVLDGIVVTVQLPETWAYSYEPDYNGMYFHQMFANRENDREGEAAKDEKVLYFHYGSDEGCFSVCQGEKGQEAGEWEDYTFPDGTSGGRMVSVSRQEDRYQEELYHEETGMLVCLDAPKSEYEEYKGEIRRVFDSIAFGTESLTERMGADGKTVESYELHLYEWAMKVDLVAPAGIFMEWEGDRLEIMPKYFSNTGNDMYVFGGCERLSYGEDGENIMYIGTEIWNPIGVEPKKKIDTVTLASGAKGERIDFIYEGEEWSYVQIFYPDVRILFHGDEMEKMLQSICPW